MPLQFGTDGVRGVANAELTPELVLHLGRAAARVLDAGSFVIGRDTRRSGPMLAAALAAGLAAEGVDVLDAGVLPTPGVAFLAAAGGLPAAVVSASHNPFSDNGIKLLAGGGRKLDDNTEAAIEAELQSLAGGSPAAGDRAAAQGVAVGRIEPAAEAGRRYTDHLVAALDGRRLDGLRVVCDCGNGAAAPLAGEVFAAAGAHVTVINADPDGTNINAGCGSTDPSGLQAAVQEHGAELGLAFDGDADRVVAVDHTGAVIDGDQVMAVLAADLRSRGLLVGDTIVVTVMSNLGLRLAMEEQGITVVETPVGDRHVSAALDAGGWSLGGEQSGHIIFPAVATTGDGMLTGLLLADAVVRAATPLATVAAHAMTRLPQVLVNVRVGHRRPDVAGAIAADIERISAELGTKGRVLVRPSGTEPVVRVMVEAPTEEAAAAAAEQLATAVRRACQP